MPKPKTVIATIDPKTGMGWKFKSRLFEFGAAWLGDIDKMVARNANPAAIREWLVENYNGPLTIPDRKTIGSYAKWKKESLRVTAGAAVRIRKDTERTEAELRAMMARLDIADADVSNRKLLLERTIRFLLVRTESISQVQENVLDPRFETAITNHLSLVKTITDTLLKLEGQLGAQNYAARRTVEKFMAELAPVIKQAAEDTYGSEKLKAFLDRLNRGYRTIDFERIKREAAIEAATMGVEEVLDVLEQPTRHNAG